MHKAKYLVLSLQHELQSDFGFSDKRDKVLFVVVARMEEIRAELFKNLTTMMEGFFKCI